MQFIIRCLIKGIAKTYFWASRRTQSSFSTHCLGVIFAREKQQKVFSGRISRYTIVSHMCDYSKVKTWKGDSPTVEGITDIIIWTAWYVYVSRFNAFPDRPNDGQFSPEAMSENYSWLGLFWFLGFHFISWSSEPLGLEWFFTACY